MSEFIIEMDKWDRIGNKYVFPETPDKCSWYDKGLVPKNDYTADLYGWYGFSFETEVHGQAEIEIRAGLLDFGEINAEEVIDYYTWRAVVVGDGTVTVTAPLCQFDLLSSMPAKWRFLRSIEINREVKELKALRGRGICAYSRVLSKPAMPGETVDYEIRLTNCLDKKQAVSFCFEKEGWETLEPSVEPGAMILDPFEEKTCHMRVTMNERIAEGGFEKQVLHILPNGSGLQSEKLEFYTVRHMRHPYIINTEQGWNEVKEKIEKYEWAKDQADLYIKRAEEWQVPVVHEKDYMFITENAHKCCNCAIVWKLTGRYEFAEKAAEFLRRLSDPEKGYPKRLKAGHQQLVHEGEFFKSCAMAYDLIYDLDVLSGPDHRNIDETFRIFIEFLDWALADGGISNWSLAEIAGALYCSMALQDRERIERFVFGRGGALEHLRAGVLSDGWWCECTIGYNQMAAGLFSEYTVALRPWGINLANWWVPAHYSSKVHFRNQHADGLCWDIYGENTRNYRCIEDLWDSLVAMANYRSVVQGVNDSAEEQLEGASRVSFDSRYDIAYAIYKKPEYACIIRNGGEGVWRDLLHGVGELPEVESDVYKKSYYFSNSGIALLRSSSEDRDDSERIEASLKYGSHGGAHGHYDRCALNAVSRFGKALFNPENVWYSYCTFMYKFYVQNSITHNMVTVDLKLQDPQEGKQVLFHSGSLFQASAVENCARWSNPPYGGWRVRADETFRDRTWAEGRYVPIPENAPPYTERTAFTEPVMQRRCAVVTDDYVVCFDYICGETEHDYDCIYHLPGLRSIAGEQLRKTGSAEQLAADPLSSAQFITDVDNYIEKGAVKLSFSYDYDKNVSAKAPWLTYPFRSGHNVPGTMNTDLYYLSDSETELFVGCDPEYYPVSKRLFYSVEADGEKLAEGRFGAWILGRDHIDIDVSGRKKLLLRVRTEEGMLDNGPENTIKTIFWGDPYFETMSGERIYLADMDHTTDNVDCGRGIGVDYEGGPVRIQAKLFEKAVPGDVIDKSREGIIEVDISGIGAVRFVSDIGGDYPVGDESRRRRFISQRRHGKSAEFISVLEPYTEKKMIESAEYISGSEIELRLTDGRIQRIIVSGMSSGDISVKMEEYSGGKLIRCESRGDKDHEG